MSQNILFLVMLLLLLPLEATPLQITTVVGTGAATSSGDNLPATSATVTGPRGVWANPLGTLFVSDFGGNKIRRVATGTTVITTAVGTGTAGASGDGGAATAATLQGPRQIFGDTNNNLYIVDNTNNKVRLVAFGTDIITLFAGTGASSSTGDGGLAVSATIKSPYGVWRDPASGTVYISEFSGNYIRKVSASNIITTLAGTGAASSSGDNVQASAANINSPAQIHGDSSGNLYVAEEKGGKFE